MRSAQEAQGAKNGVSDLDFRAKLWLGLILLKAMRRGFYQGCFRTADTDFPILKLARRLVFGVLGQAMRSRRHRK